MLSPTRAAVGKFFFCSEARARPLGGGKRHTIVFPRKPQLIGGAFFWGRDAYGRPGGQGSLCVR